MISVVHHTDYRDKLPMPVNGKVYNHYDLLKEMRKDLKNNGFVSSVKLSRMPGIGQYAKLLKREAKKNNLDAIKTESFGTVKWYYRESEAIKVMKELKSRIEGGK